MAGARAILALGATAYAAVTGRAAEESGLMAMRGYPHHLGGAATNDAEGCLCERGDVEGCPLHGEAAMSSREVEVAQFGSDG